MKIQLWQKKKNLEISSAKWLPFCLDHNVWKNCKVMFNQPYECICAINFDGNQFQFMQMSETTNKIQQGLYGLLIFPFMYNLTFTGLHDRCHKLISFWHATQMDEVLQVCLGCCLRVGNMAILVIPGSKVHGANMGPIWGRQDPYGPHVGPRNFAIWDMQYLSNFTPAPPN